MSFANKHPWLCSGLSALAIALSSFSLGNTLGPSITRNQKVEVTEGLESVLKTEEQDKYNLQFYSFPTAATDFNGDGMEDTFYAVEYSDKKNNRVFIPYSISGERLPEVCIGPIRINGNLPETIYVKESAEEINKNIRFCSRELEKKSGDIKVKAYASRGRSFDGDKKEDEFSKIKFRDLEGRDVSIDYGISNTGKNVYIGSMYIYNPALDASFCSNRYVVVGNIPAVQIPDPFSTEIK